MASVPDQLAVIHERLHVQGVGGAPFATALDAVRALGAVQGQEYAEAKWAIGRRVRDATEPDIEAALARGQLVRTHALRPTWHIIAAEDLRWVQRATAHRVHRTNKHIYARTGLDPDTLARSDEVLVDGLADGEPRTRAELADALAAAGIDARGMRLAHAVMHAELEAVVCSGPRRGRQHTYVLAERYLPEESKRLSRADAQAELAVRYFAGHGPATLRDFTWWSSLTQSEAKKAVRSAGDRLGQTVATDGTTWIHAPDRAGQEVTGGLLLSMFDESVIAFKDLRAVPASPPPTSSGRANPALVAGRTIGRWHGTVSRHDARVALSPLADLNPCHRAALEAETTRYGDFHGVPAVLEVDEPVWRAT